MSDEQDEPLFGLLTDIAEGVAKLTARMKAIGANAAVHQEQMNEALATTAEIATRTYYSSKPTYALPNDVINANVKSHDRTVANRMDNDVSIVGI